MASKRPRKDTNRSSSSSTRVSCTPRENNSRHQADHSDRTRTFIAQESIFSIRRIWRPPSKSVVNHASKICSTVDHSVNLAPMEIIFALLCRRANLAVSTDQQSAQRIPWIRFAEIASPFPDPPKTIPRSHCPSETAIAAGQMKSG